MKVPVKGQILYSLNIGNAVRHRKQELTPVTVMKVGRKYFYCAKESYENIEGCWIKYDMETWRNVSDYSATSQIYSSAAEWENKKELENMTQEIRNILGSYGSFNISETKIRAIYKILTEEDKNE